MNDKELDEILNKYVSNYNLDVLGFRESGQAKVKQAIQSLLKQAELRGMRKSEKEHTANYRWLLGYENFPSCPSGKKYCWRSHLRKRLSPGILAELESQMEKEG